VEAIRHVLWAEVPFLFRLPSRMGCSWSELRGCTWSERSYTYIYIQVATALLVAVCAVHLKKTYSGLYIYIYLYIYTYHMRNNYVTYIAMWSYVTRLLCVAQVSTLAQLSLRWIPRSRGKVDVMTWGWLRAEISESSSYSWCLLSH